MNIKIDISGQGHTFYAYSGRRCMYSMAGVSLGKWISENIQRNILLERGIKPPTLMSSFEKCLREINAHHD